MNRPIIGISTSIIIDEGGMFPGYHRSYVNRDYVRSVLAAGGIPIMIPMSGDKEAVSTALSLCDGLILSGGQDVYPLNYGEEPHRGLGGVCPERDEFDYALYREAKEKDMPVLGICRGSQIIATAEGGKLYQDLSEMDNALKHNQGHTPDMPSHHVNIAEGTKLHKIFGENRIAVNSFHHQVIKSVGEDFTVAATAPDGAIEGLEHKTAKFIVAVQWHPEMMHATNEHMLNLFKALVDQCR
ncbi:gamma-glutamyl-gamma-aminobutyrate hydrolase family protein [Oribacterium sp. P6A1]|uniref:gamma-glutamyl-gamma-aminobutyrate hydrolase family protein n=1 Tax=Oribacterium sp. P6A1 TaxID=1410612 RepID=UPI00056941A6|nr:gamma-glutamyl-gamma-aminobutyrate hydrolase family protein [Oribacterium sp. P6A1]